MRKDAGRKNPRRIRVPEHPTRPRRTHHTPQSPPDVQVAIESTGNLWIPIYDHLENEHIHTVLTNPKKTRMIAEAKIKTDKLDARILADLLRANLLSPSYVPPPEIRMQRSIIRERARLTQLRTIIKNRIHALLDKHAYKSPYTDIFGKHGLEWLHKLDLPPTDRTLLEVNLEQVTSLNHSIDRLTETIAISAITNPEVKLAWKGSSSRPWS